MAESSSRPWCLDARKHARWGWDYVNLSGFSPLFRISSFLAGTSEGVAVLAIVGIGRTREESQQSPILISFANIDPTASFVRHLTDLLWGYIAISYVNKESRDDGGQKCFLFFLPWRRSPGPPPSFLPLRRWRRGSSTRENEYERREISSPPPSITMGLRTNSRKAASGIDARRHAAATESSSAPSQLLTGHHCA